MIGEDRADYLDRLGERAARSGRSVEEFEAILEERNMLRGTVDEVRTRQEELIEAGISRLYIQVYAALSDIDTGDVGRVLRLLRD